MLTQKVKGIYQVYLLNLCTQKVKGIYQVYLYIVVDTESKRKSIGYYLLNLCTQKIIIKLLDIFIYFC